MTTNTNNPSITTKKPSNHSSRAGAVLAILALISAGIGHGLVHAKPEETGQTNDSVANAVGGTGEAVGHATLSLIGVPFLVGAIVLGIIAIVFILMRFTKARAMGLLLNVGWLLLSVWAIDIAIRAFELLKAHA